VTTRPAYFAYYNSLPGNAQVSATDYTTNTQGNELLGILKKKRGSVAPVNLRTKRRFPVPFISIQGLNSLGVDLTSAPSVSGTKASLGSPLFQTGKENWIANLQWEVDPFWNPKKDRPTRQWAQQLKVSHFRQPLGFFQDIVESQIFERYSQSRQSKPMEARSISSIQQKAQKPGRLKKHRLAKFHFDIAVIPNKEESQSSRTAQSTLASSAEEAHLENSLQNIESVIKSIGYRKPALASKSILPVATSLPGSVSKKESDGNSGSFCFGDIPNNWTESDFLEVQRQNRFWKHCLRDSFSQIIGDCESFAKHWIIITANSGVKFLESLEDILPAGTCFADFFQAFFLPGNMEMARPLLTEPGDCLDYNQFRQTDRLASARKIPPVTSKAWDFTGGWNPNLLLRDLSAGMGQLAKTGNFTSGRILGTVTIVANGLRFEKPEFQNLQIEWISPLDMGLAGWQGERSSPVRSVIPKIPFGKREQRIQWMEMAYVQDQMFYQGKHKMEAESGPGQFWAKVRSGSGLWVASWQHWIAQTQENLKFGGFFDGVQNRTKKRVVLEQKGATRR